jgi:hypothetical protein
MKDIYIIMSHQNILKFYRGFIDIKVDNSEFYDVLIEQTDKIQLTLDYSEYFDVELDYTTDLNDYILPIINETVIIYFCDYTVLTENDFLINTQNGECIQYEH